MRNLRIIPNNYDIKTMDTEIILTAKDWAETLISNIKRSTVDPSFSIQGEELRIYRELTEIGWFDICPLGTDEDQKTILLIALQKYAKLKWDKDNPIKPKKSKWEVVTGQKAKR